MYETTNEYCDLHESWATDELRCECFLLMEVSDEGAD